MHFASIGAVANVHIRNVPKDVHDQLKARAAAADQSLNEYLLGQLRMISTLPTPQELAERIRERGTYEGPSSAAIIRQDRDTH